MAYRYADTRAKHIDLQIKSDYASNRRVLCPHNTDNLHEIKVINPLVSFNSEGVVIRVQHLMNQMYLPVVVKLSRDILELKGNNK